MWPRRSSDIIWLASMKSGAKMPRFITMSRFLALTAAPFSTIASSRVSASGVSTSVQNPFLSDLMACLTWSVEQVAMSTRSMSRSSSMSANWRNMRWKN